MRTLPPGSGWGLSLGRIGADGIGSAAQRLAGLPVAVAIQIRVALAQQLLGAGIGADLLAEVAAAAGSGAIGNHRSGAAAPEIPGPGDPALLLPDAVAMSAGTELGIEVLIGVTAAEVAPVGKGLPVLDHDQIDVDVAGHLRHRAAVAVGGVGLDIDLSTPRQTLHQIGARLLTPGAANDAEAVIAMTNRASVRWGRGIKDAKPATAQPGTGLLSSGDRCRMRIDFSITSTRRRPMWGRLSTGCGSWPWHLGLDRVGCLCIHAWPALCLTGEEKGSRLWEEMLGA